MIRHVEIEHLGYLGEALAAGSLRCTYVDAQSLKSDTPIASAALLALGGPAGAYETDTHPYLAYEIALIRRYLDAGLPVLGVCLGSQLLAAACGSRVFPGNLGKEIGWAEVELTAEGVVDPLWAGFPARFTTFHWHGDTFEIPDGANLLAQSEKYVQAFRVGPNAYGIQFHPEVVPKELTSWIRAYRLELERERMTSADVLNVPSAEDHRVLAFKFGENVARWINATAGQAIG